MGIYLYNPDIIPEVAFASSSLTSIKVRDDEVASNSGSVTHYLLSSYIRNKRQPTKSLSNEISVILQSGIHMCCSTAAILGDPVRVLPINDIHDATLVSSS